MQKLRGCCNQARKDNLKYTWIDTCCINKENPAELNEAINSMFQWYQKASVCYTLLLDVPPGDDPCDAGSKFHTSRWFQRGWTLQELLAPKDLRFYNREWIWIGSKEDMPDEIEAVTGISRQYLLGWQDFRQASVAQRMSWMAKRQTSKKDDKAYCLLGIFDVAIPMIYGASDQAFCRLQREIMKKTGDHSILAWDLDIPENLAEDSTDVLSAGTLATAPSDFANCRNIISRAQEPTHLDTLGTHSGCLLIHLPLHTTSTGKIYGLLSCGPEGDAEHVVGLPLRKAVPGAGSDEYYRPQRRCATLLPRAAPGTPATLVRIKTERALRSREEVGRRFWLYVKGHRDVNLKREEDYPPLDWDKGRAVMAEATDLNKVFERRYFVRFRADDQGLQDVVVVIEYAIRKLRLHARSHIMSLSRDAPLQELSRKFVYLRPGALGKQSVSNGRLKVKVTTTEEDIAQQPFFAISMSRASNESEATVDGSLELNNINLQLELVGMLQKEDRIRLETQQATLQIDEKMNDLARMKERLTTTEENLKKLCEEKRALSEEIERAAHEADKLTDRLDAARQKQDELLGPGSRMQQNLHELETNQTPRDWLETIIKKYLDTGEAGDFLKNLEEVSPAQPLTVAERGCNNDNKHPLSWTAMNGFRAMSKVLLDNGADLNVTREDGNTPLSLAALNGHEAVVTLLLEMGADIEVQNSNGDTALSLGAQAGSETVVKLLLREGADLETQNNNGDTPLARAASNNHESIVSILLDKGARSEIRDKGGCTPLLRAAIDGHVPVVRLLIQKGADLEANIGSGNTLLSLAAVTGQVALGRLLLDEGAELETKNHNGDTPLSLGAQRGHEAVVRLLLERGADLETRSRHGDTPLARAALNGQVHMVRILLGEGANLEATNNNSSTPILRASSNGHEAVVGVLLEADANFERRNKCGDTPLLRAALEGYDAVAKLLVDKGADLEKKDQDDYSPLSLGARKGHEAVVRLLLGRGAGLETKNKYGDTPLARAALNGHEGVVRMLLDEGADLETTNNNGSTPLLHATLDGYEGVVRVLLEKGADLEKRNNRGDTPMSRATSEGHEHVVRLLLKKDADLSRMVHW
ncbi:hypothetical protein ACHAPJ_006937 [Fusarium lateritium]